MIVEIVDVPRLGQIQIRNRPGRIKSRQNITQFFYVPRVDPARLTCFVETLQALVPDRPDHPVRNPLRYASQTKTSVQKLESPVTCRYIMGRNSLR